MRVSSSVMALQDDVFAHEPLDTSKATIRVLKLTSFSKKKGIRCILKHIDLADDAYVCLSYTWGEDTPSHTIYINDRCFQVRDCLWTFLQKAQKQEIRDWLWIDAICIDQQNTAERNQQVRLMGDVYSRAKHVLVYAGTVSWRIAILAVLLRMLGTKSRIYQRDKFLEFAVNLLPSSSSGFAQTDYWKRLWIVQEVLLAKKVLLILNRTQLSLEYLELAYRSRFSQEPPWSIMYLRWLHKHNSISALNMLLGYTTKSRYQRQHDRIYGLLGLVLKEVSDEIVIDYNREWSLVVLDTLQAARDDPFPTTNQGNLASILHHLSWPVIVLCGDCANSASVILKLANGCVVTPISKITNEQQEIFLIAGFVASISDEGSESPITARMSHTGVLCSRCEAQVVPDRRLHFIYSRPLEHVLCGRVREDGETVRNFAM